MFTAEDIADVFNDRITRIIGEATRVIDWLRDSNLNTNYNDLSPRERAEYDLNHDSALQYSSMIYGVVRTIDSFRGKAAYKTQSSQFDETWLINAGYYKALSFSASVHREFGKSYFSNIETEGL